MKKILILALAVVMSASVVYAQPGGVIGLYSDPAYCSCDLTPDVAYATYNVYVVHYLAANARASQWKLTNNITGALLNEGPANWGTNLILGDLHAGVTVTYVGCKALPWLVATIPYFYYGTPGTDPTCTYSLFIEPDPGSASGQVESLDCDGVTQIATGLSLTFFGDPVMCPCSFANCRACAAGNQSCIVGTEQTSWSKIKSLYR